MSWLSKLLGWFKLTSLTPLPLVELTLLELHNEARKNKGLSALKINPQLKAAAQGWAYRMAGMHTLSHGNFSYRIYKVDYLGSIIGENIAEGYLSAETVFAGWLRSPKHAKNIFKPDYKEIGIGCATECIKNIEV
jgi:uncharacterized protein YkwD